MKNFLEKLLERKKAEMKKAEEKNQAATTVEEVRAIGETLLALKDEIAEIEKQLADLDNNDNNEPEETPAATEEGRGLNPMATFRTAQITNTETDPYATKEYRMAFKNYVQRGVDNFPKIEKRADEFTVSSEVGKIIPNTILNEFIRQVVEEKHGQIFAKVRKLSVKGGVEIPVSDLSAAATWIAEATVSETKKAGEINASITFAYHTLELRISETLLASIVSLDLFESEIVKLLVAAFAKELDRVILEGTGSGQPLGILKDSRVTNVVEFTEEEFNDWTSWRKNLFAKIPLSKRGSGEFLMTAATWESEILTLQDSNGNPIAKVAADVADGELSGRFFGRQVTLVEPNVIKDFATAAAGDVVGIFWVPNDYIVNTNLQLAYKRYFNDDTNKWVNKGIVICDGKIADPKAFYIIKKKATPSA